MWDRGATSLLGRSRAGEGAELDRTDAPRERSSTFQNKAVGRFETQRIGKPQTRSKSQFHRHLLEHGTSVNTEGSCERSQREQDPDGMMFMGYQGADTLATGPPHPQKYRENGLCELTGETMMTVT